MTEHLNFAIIIPARNEKPNLERLLPVLVTLYPASPIFVVDDNSPDGTGKYVLQFSRKFPSVHLLLRKNRRGRGSAVLDGLKEAAKNKKTGYFLEMDADFSHNPEEIEKLLKIVKVKETGDAREGLPARAAARQSESEHGMGVPSGRTRPAIIIGSRHIAGAKFVNCDGLRVFLSILANRYAKLILGIPIQDYTNGFRLYPRSAVEVLLQEKITEKGYIFLSETAYILHRKGFTFREVPIIFINRTVGRSNATIAEFLRSIPAILRIRSRY